MKSLFEKNTAQVNRIIAKILAVCSAAIFIMVGLSLFGFFQFGSVYTVIVLFGGLLVSLSPCILIKFLSDNFMRYYMLILLAVFMGAAGSSNNVGVYITYALAPIISCLYFDPKFTVKITAFSYLVMAVSLYISAADRYEVIYEHMTRMHIFIAYLVGFTIEYAIVGTVLYYLVKRARGMMERRYSAEEENRMKSRFLSNMSHEIRTPMNAIIGMSDAALRKDMSDDLRHCLTVIKTSSTGLLEIVNDILDLSKVEAGKLNIISEEYTTSSLADDMAAIIDARNIDGRVPIYYHISENMPPVLVGDAVRIKQVMLNFASNAIKYTESGRIDISLECEKISDDTAVMKYSVKDTGQGIRSEDMDKLFTMYAQLNAVKNHGTESTGIGLAISKYFIDRMGGTVSAESVFGKGSTFSFTVPQTVGSAEKMPQTDEKATDPYSFTANGAEILLVDDNDINREVVRAILEPLELSVDEASDGREAVDMAAAKKYDMILMDSHMPVMNGEEATAEIRSSDSINCETPIIALTADAVSGVRERLIECGMNDYIVKPIDIAVICGIIKKYLPESKIKT